MIRLVRNFLNTSCFAIINHQTGGRVGAVYLTSPRLASPALFFIKVKSMTVHVGLRFAAFVWLVSLDDALEESVCDTLAPASQRLRNFRPLRIASLSGYPTYSDFDNGTFLNNTYDASLLFQLQLQLGLHHEAVQLVQRPPGWTWEEFVPTVFDDYDMILTYWSRNQARQEIYSIPAHTTNNRVIVISRYFEEEDGGVPTLEIMVDFFWSPFTNQLWQIFFGLFFLNSLGLYIIEYDHQDFQGRGMLGSLGLALYFSFSLLTGACQHNPNTTAGRILFAAWGVCIVLSLAWYTGDLAGSQAAEELGVRIQTVRELVQAGTVVCYPTSDTRALGELDALEDQIVYHATKQSVRTFAVSLPTGTKTAAQIEAMEEMMERRSGCGAMVVPQKAYDELLRARQASETCDKHRAYTMNEPLVSSAAGWAVSFNISGCLIPALEYAFQVLRYTPEIGGTDVMANLEQQFLKSACDEAEGSKTSVALSHLGLPYFLYVCIFCAVCVAALIKHFHKRYCSWMPPDLVPASSVDLHRTALQSKDEHPRRVRFNPNPPLRVLRPNPKSRAGRQHVAPPSMIDVDHPASTSTASPAEYSAPASSAPARSAPESSAPASSAPEYSAPARSAPEYSAPARSAPACSPPESSAPERAEYSAPAVHVLARSIRVSSSIASEEPKAPPAASTEPSSLSEGSYKTAKGLLTPG